MNFIYTESLINELRIFAIKASLYSVFREAIRFFLAKKYYLKNRFEYPFEELRDFGKITGYENQKNSLQI
jgi:hypothetical protein